MTYVMTAGTADKQEAGGMGVKSEYRHRDDGKMVLQEERTGVEREAHRLTPEKAEVHSALRGHLGQDGTRLCVCSRPVTLLDTKGGVVRELIEEQRRRGVRIRLISWTGLSSPSNASTC